MLLPMDVRSYPPSQSVTNHPRSLTKLIGGLPSNPPQCSSYRLIEQARPGTRPDSLTSHGLIMPTMPSPIAFPRPHTAAYLRPSDLAALRRRLSFSSVQRPSSGGAHQGGPHLKGQVPMLEPHLTPARLPSSGSGFSEHGREPAKRMKLSEPLSESAALPGFDLQERQLVPPVSFGRRGLLGLTAAALGIAAAESTGLGPALAAVAGPTSDAASVSPAPETTKLALKIPVVEKKLESRVYDATVLGEPMALGNKSKAWQKMLGSRVVYLGEAERVHDPTDKVLELEIIEKLRDECFAQGRPVTLALSAFPRPMQADLDAFFGGKLTEAALKAKVSHWAPGRWEETLPILRYCKDHGVRLFAAGVPPEVLRTVQSHGIHALSSIDRKKYAPARGQGAMASSATTHVTSATKATPVPSVSAVPNRESFLGSLLPSLELPANAEGVFGQEGLFHAHPPGTQSPFGQGPHLFAQARAVEQHTMVQAVSQAMADGGAVGLLIVVTGASHVLHGARGKGVPARVDTKQKKQVVVLLNPERQATRTEGSLPEADYLWYASTRACTRNCFDRAEVARVMGAAGRRRDGLPLDLQKGLERGLISPETLQSFFELESQPWIAEATKRFQGLRERFYADPKFLHRLCIEEAISISTSLAAQYNRRGERFWSEIEYVATDIIRGAVVDFFTVWLPAPTLSFDSKAMDPANELNTLGAPGSGSFLQALGKWVGSLPDNAFQRPMGAGQDWTLVDRAGAVVMGGAKLFGVGFVSSVGTVGVNNGLQALRRRLSGAEHHEDLKRSPILKTALVYGGFLGTSANLRYQAIAGLVEHWAADYFLATQPLAGAALSFAARTANSYWGTGQWVDLAKRFGLQAHADEGASGDAGGVSAAAAGQSSLANGASSPHVEGVPAVVPEYIQADSGLLLPEVKVEVALPHGLQTQSGMVDADIEGMAEGLAALSNRLENVLKLEVEGVPHLEGSGEDGRPAEKHNFDPSFVEAEQAVSAAKDLFTEGHIFVDSFGSADAEQYLELQVAETLQPVEIPTDRFCSPAHGGAMAVDVETGVVEFGGVQVSGNSFGAPGAPGRGVVVDAGSAVVELTLKTTTADPILRSGEE